MNKKFTKRIFTPKTYIKELTFLGRHVFEILKIFTTRNKDDLLTEKLLMILSVSNDCKYCIWLDTQLAEKRGVSSSEIQKMLNLQLDTKLPEEELKALIYAQHYAETNGNPLKRMTDNLYEFYGKQKAEKILLTIRAEMFGNLYFNTWKAVKSRFKGLPAPNSNMICEWFFVLFNFPVVIPFVLIKRLENVN